jgi:hypothetical protein
MKEISEVEETPFTSSFKIYPEACCLRAWQRNAPPPPITTTLFPNCFVDISFKDDVAVLFLLGVSQSS